MKLFKKKRYSLTLIAALVGVGVFPVTPARAAVTWSTVIHPEADAQPTALGRRIHAADKSGSLVYFGYGDYDTNTGPIVIRSLNPASGVLSARQFTQDTEAIEVFRTIGGKIYSPAIDTTQGYDFAVNESGEWSQPATKITSYHLYDITQRVPGELLLSGSTYAHCAITGCDGAVWKSTDGGVTWAHSFLERAGKGKDLSRCFEMVSFKSVAYVRCSSGDYSYDGHAWQEDTHQLASYDAVIFDGRLITTRSGIKSFDGTTLRYIVRNSDSGTVAVDGGYLYLKQGEEVLRTDDLDTCGGGLPLFGETITIPRTTIGQTCPFWVKVAEIPPSVIASDFTVVNGHIVLGGPEGRIHHSSKLPA